MERKPYIKTLRRHHGLKGPDSDRLWVAHDEADRLAEARQVVSSHHQLEDIRARALAPKGVCTCAHFEGNHRDDTGCYVPGCECSAYRAAWRGDG